MIGGEVFLEGGYLSTSEGNLEIGSIAPENRVNLRSHPYGWTLDYQRVNGFADININNAGKIDAGVTGGSNIILTGKNISLGYDLASIAEVGYELNDFFTLQPLSSVDRLAENKVDITARNKDNTTPTQISINARETFSNIKGGNLINTTDGKGDAGAIEIIADTAVIYSGGFEAGTQEDSSGNGGIVTFNVNRMSVQNGGGGVNTLGSGDGGTIDLNIANELKIQSGGFGADTFSTGNGGRIEIDAHNLEVISGRGGVNTLGSGNGGTIDLNIANELKIQFGGFGADTVSTGNGGNIEIDAKTLDMRFGGIGVNTRNIGKGGKIQIKAETIFFDNAGIGAKSGQDLDEIDFDSNELQRRFGRRDAGDGGIISIEAESLFLGNNSNISTTTFGVGNAGAINLKVGFLKLRGNNRTTITSSTVAAGDGGNIEISSNKIAIAEDASIVANSTNVGDAGDISLKANNIIQLQDRGRISVDGSVKERSGNITLHAHKIDLAETSSISARVNLGNEGNIFLTGNNLFLDDLSQITTNSIGNSTGGNIAINLQDNLLMLAGSKIVATSVNGQGGKIQIQTTGFFPSFNSAIDASSKFGIDGTVQVDTPNVDPNSGLIQLLSTPIDSSLYLTRGCGLRSNASLVNVGRGGLSENPFNTVVNTVVLPDIPIPSNQKTWSWNQLSLNSVADNLTENSIIEAEAWKTNLKGNIELIAKTQKHNLNHFSDRNFCLHKSNQSN